MVDQTSLISLQTLLTTTINSEHCDICKAFDPVWYKGLLCKFKGLDFHISTLRFLNIFMEATRAQIKSCPILNNPNISKSLPRFATLGLQISHLDPQQKHINVL